MLRIFFAVLEVSAAAIVLLPVYLILNQFHFHQIRKSMFYCIFSFYLVAVYALVGLPNVTYCSFGPTLNFIPFIGMMEDLKNSILNVLLFVPLGVMLPILWDRYRTMKATVVFGLIMSAGIEILQIFVSRATDINDLITNVIGTVFGYFLAKGLMILFPSIKELVHENCNKELYGVCGITFAVMFFIQPFISAAMWELIL